MANLAKMYSSIRQGSTVRFISYPNIHPAAGEPQRRYPDLTKAANELGYSAQVDLAKTGP